ncbi:unnamed protein product [Tilletia caries]|nr:unnamed protein product [Tilletia caries]
MVCWDYPQWVVITFIISLVLLSIFLAVCLVVIIERVRRGASWILRFGQGEKRALIVPHAQNGWTFSVSIYFLLVLACVCDVYVSTREHKPIQHIPLWVICLFTPLAMGVWLQLWGIFLAAMPQQLTGEFTSYKVPARVMNTVCLCFPPLAFTILMVPTAISDYHWHRVATKDWPAFQHRYQDETELSREMLVDAQKIWNHLLRFSFMMSVACMTWVIICVGMTAVYVWINWRTISSLRSFLATQKPTSASSASADKAPSPTVRMVDIRAQGAGVRYSPPQTIMDRTKDDPTHQDTSLTRQTESAGGLVKKMGHQAAQKVLTYFTVQCICIFAGGICLQCLAAGVAATHYPEMERHSRCLVLPTALAVCCYITLFFGAIMLASVAYSSLEQSFLPLLQASVSAKARLYRGGIGNLAAKRSSATSEAEGGLEAALRSTANLEGDPPHSDHGHARTTTTTLARCPSPGLPSKPSTATLRCSHGLYSTSPGDGAATLPKMLYFSNRSFASDQEPVFKSRTPPIS